MSAVTAAQSRDLATVWAGRLYDEAIHSGSGPLFLRRSDGWMLPLPVERWCQPPDAVDHDLLRRCHGTVLDIGCGPGRLVSQLQRLGRRVLGVDVSPAAVARTTRSGGPAVCASIFEPIPHERRWDTALLADGNIGIGGDPVRLLGRIAEILHPRGQLLAELAYDDVDESLSVCVDDGRGRSGVAFPWARVGETAMKRYATASGWTIAAAWSHEPSRRRFVCLRAA